MPVYGSILKTSQNQTVGSGTSQTELWVLPLWKWSCYDVLHVLFREARRPQSESAATSPCQPDFGKRTWQASEITWLRQRLHSNRSWAKEGFIFFSGLQCECLPRGSKRREGLIEWKRPLLGAREMGQRLKTGCCFCKGSVFASQQPPQAACNHL